MTNIYYADSDDLRATIELEMLSNYFCESDRVRALRYRRSADGYNFLLGRMLLKWGLRTNGFSDDISEITYSEVGKPRISATHFSISHSSYLVGCALDRTGEVGLDIEMRSDKDLAMFRASFTESEWHIIMQASSPLDSFLQFWTRKEAIIKALGITLGEMHAIELDSMQSELSIDGRNWYLHDVQCDPGFVGALCTQTEDFAETIVPAEDLMEGLRWRY